MFEAVASGGEWLAVEGPVESKRVAIGVGGVCGVCVEGEGGCSSGFGEVESSDGGPIASAIDKARNLAVGVVPPLVAVLDEVERAVGSDF